MIFIKFNANINIEKELNIRANKMIAKNLKQFFHFLLQDQSVQENLKEATDQESFVQMAVKLGKDKGYKFTIKELEAAISQAKSPIFEELSDEQLELVAGGKKAGGDGWTIGLSCNKNCN